MDRPVTLVLAATVPALGIGYKGGLPWKLSRELKYFRQVTTNGIVVMGRNTWDSIPPKFRPLKQRTNVVVTSRPLEGVLTASSLEDALAKVKNVKGECFIIGGAQLYASALKLPNARKLLLTEIDDDKNEIVCDRFFDYDKGQWASQSFDRLREVVGPQVELEEKVEENGLRYQFRLYER